MRRPSSDACAGADEDSARANICSGGSSGAEQVIASVKEMLKTRALPPSLWQRALRRRPKVPYLRRGRRRRRRDASSGSIDRVASSLTATTRAARPVRVYYKKLFRRAAALGDLYHGLSLQKLLTYPARPRIRGRAACRGPLNRRGVAFRVRAVWEAWIIRDDAIRSRRPACNRRAKTELRFRREGISHALDANAPPGTYSTSRAAN